MTMELRDLPARKDVRGGSPKSPYPPIPSSNFEDNTPWKYQGIPNGSTLWRTIALCEASVIVTSIAWLLSAGIDNVKHSEIQNIMDTRAPYIHAKPELEQRFKSIEATNARIEMNLQTFREEFRQGDASILNRVSTLERDYYSDHPTKK